MSQPNILKKATLSMVLAGLLAAIGTWLLPGDNAADVSGSLDTALAPHSSSSIAPPAPDGMEEPPMPAPHVAADALPYRTPSSLGDKPFASSLEGTDIDGRLQADANGRLVINLQTKDFFDYFLNTVGEVPPDRALAEIESLARNSLPQQAANEAMAVLGQYLDYKQQALALGNATLDPSRQRDPEYQLAMFRDALNDLKQLRSASFNPETHAAFFGLEEAYGDYTLTTLHIQQRDDLSASAKETLQAWHRQQLPEVIRQTETRQFEDETMQARRQVALAEAASPEDAGRRLRDLGLTFEQAGEVVTYLEDRKRFQGTFEQYQTELNQLQQAGLAPDDMAARKTQLLNAHFSNEQTRTWARLKSMATNSP